MLLDPTDINWRNADDSTVFYAARDGVPQAQAEMRRREGLPQDIAQAVKATRVTRKFNH